MRLFMVFSLVVIVFAGEKILIQQQQIQTLKDSLSNCHRTIQSQDITIHLKRKGFLRKP